ncbi:hypothetical protein [Flagellimonas onchidii]|uniref:hypothetical protein n=1 Tax=Flagellimonas onchidii TaxID=2562684 RepID=UPI0010A5C7A5|nr:hypothetical protein [Allomuricauda onchidii]
MLTVVPERTKEVLTRFGKEVVRESKKELKRQKKSTSGKLAKSIDYDLTVSKKSFGLSFLGEDYLEYQDKGVNGFLKNHGSPFSYKDKRPPLKALDKWIVRKGIAPKDAKGRFLSRKSIQFLISRKIFFEGIKSNLFFSKPFEKHFKQLPEEVIAAFALDTEQFLKQTLK